MTAAALKQQDLFTHLFATRPERADRGSLASALMAVTLHGTLVAAVVWASINWKPDRPSAPADEPPPLVVVMRGYAPAEAGPSRGGGAPVSTGPALSVPAPPSFDAPLPADIDSRAFVQPGDLPGGPPAGSGAPSAGGGDATTHDGFVVAKTIPTLLNGAEISRALERAYPPLLRDAGIGGRVYMWLFIDENGRVLRAELKQTSGQPALDRTALDVAPQMRFSPAMNRDQRVRIVVEVPIDFRTR